MENDNMTNKTSKLGLKIMPELSFSTIAHIYCPYTVRHNGHLKKSPPKDLNNS